MFDRDVNESIIAEALFAVSSLSERLATYRTAKQIEGNPGFQYADSRNEICPCATRPRFDAPIKPAKPWRTSSLPQTALPQGLR